MTEHTPPLSKRCRISDEELLSLTKDELLKKYTKQQICIEQLKVKLNNSSDDDNQDKGKTERSRRENVLVMRLANKEQEVQEYVAQINHIKKIQEDAALLSLQQTNLDPGINLLFGKMREELQQTKSKLEQAQSELSAWKFTPDSQNGKKLISRCRTLIAENQELGRLVSQGKTAQLEAELALQKKYSAELKASQDELNEFVIQLDEEVEGMQSTIQVLQRQLLAVKNENVDHKKAIDAYKDELSLPDEHEVTGSRVRTRHADDVDSSVSDDNSVTAIDDRTSEISLDNGDEDELRTKSESNRYESPESDGEAEFEFYDDDAPTGVRPATPSSSADNERTRVSISPSPPLDHVDDLDRNAGDAWDGRTAGRSEDGDVSSRESDVGNSNALDTDEDEINDDASPPRPADHEVPLQAESATEDLGDFSDEPAISDSNSGDGNSDHENVAERTNAIDSRLDNNDISPQSETSSDKHADLLAYCKKMLDQSSATSASGQDILASVSQQIASLTSDKQSELDLHSLELVKEAIQRLLTSDDGGKLQHSKDLSVAKPLSALTNHGRDVAVLQNGVDESGK